MDTRESDPMVDGKEAADVAALVICSICLEAVAGNKGRSTAKLHCNHEFHLDCIGSAFNVKGQMQCPNCRKVEKGQWLFANGARLCTEFNMEDWAHDEDLYDPSYAEIPLGLQWCPFNGFNRLPSLFEEGELSSNAYHDPMGHHAFFAEHTATPSSGHSCPYVAYFLQPSSSNSSESIADGPSFGHHWSGLSGPSEISTSHAFAAVDLHYHSWDPMAETPADEDGDGGEDPHEVVLLLLSSLSSFSLFSSAYLSPLLHLIPPPASSIPPTSDLCFLFPDLGSLSRPRPPFALVLNPEIRGCLSSDLGDIEAWLRGRTSTPRATMVGPRWLISAVLMVHPFRGGARGASGIEVLAVLRCLRGFCRPGEGTSGWLYPDDTGHGSGGGGIDVRDQRYLGSSCYGYGSGRGSDGCYFGGSSGDHVVCGYHQYGRRRSFSPESFSLGTCSFNEE